MASSYHGKRVLITGGLGFVGSNLLHQLQTLGAECWVIDNLQPGLGGNSRNLPQEFPKQNWINGDVSDAETFSKVPDDIDLIFHCSSQTSHVDSMVDPILDMQINVGGAIQVAMFAGRCPKKPYVVYAGTRAQVGKPFQSTVREDTRGEPTDVYGVHKQTAEDVLSLFSRVKGFPFTALVITNCYGERHQMKHAKFGVLNWFVRLAMDSRPIQIFGEGQQTREYLYIQDLVEAMILVGERRVSRRYVIGGLEPISVRRAAEIVVQCSGAGTVVTVPWPEDRKVIETGDYRSDSTKLLNDYGWKPSTDFSLGLKRTIEFYREHRTHYWGSD